MTYYSAITSLGSNTRARSTKINELIDALNSIVTVGPELEAAREGETDLQAKINVIEASVSSAAGGTYLLVSAADKNNGYGYDKITSTYLDKTITSPGGNEKLNLDPIKAGVTTTSSAVDITLTSASLAIQYLAFTAADKFVTEVDATTLPNGFVRHYFNTGNYRHGIKNSAGTFIASIDAASYGKLVLIDNSTAAGTWEAIDGADLIMARLKTVCNAMASTYISSCKMTSTTVFAAWSGTAGDGYCAILTWVPGTPAITVSTILEFDTNDAAWISCCRMTDTVAIVSNTGLDSDGYIHAITYNGTDTLVVTDTHEFLNADTAANTQVVPIHADASSGKIGLVYKKADTKLYGQVLNWTGSEITANTAETLIADIVAAQASLDLLSGAVGSASMICVTGTSASPAVYQIGWDGATLTPSSPLSLTYSTGTSVVAVTSAYFVVCQYETKSDGSSPFDLRVSLCTWSATAPTLLKSISLGLNMVESLVYIKGAFLLDASTVCLFASAIGVDQSYIYKIKVVGNALPSSCVLKLESKIYLGITGNEQSFSGLDGAGAFALYADIKNSNYLTANRIEIA